jgi:hypothetical protein
VPTIWIITYISYEEKYNTYVQCTFLRKQIQQILYYMFTNFTCVPKCNIKVTLIHTSDHYVQDWISFSISTYCTFIKTLNITYCTLLYCSKLITPSTVQYIYSSTYVYVSSKLDKISNMNMSEYQSRRWGY